MEHNRKKSFQGLITLCIFAIAFALLEASVVIYLRKLFNFDTQYVTQPVKVLLNLGFIAFLSPGTIIFPDKYILYVEILREASTIIILLAVAILSAKNLKARLGAFLIAFSIWDILYYFFLRILAGWPKSLFDIDIYFLIPDPWVGPVISPLVIFTFLLFLGLYLYLKPAGKVLLNHESK